MDAGRGTLERINTETLKLEGKNRWSTSRASILGVASRNNGVFAVGGSGNLRLLKGIQTGTREVEMDCMMTRIEVESMSPSAYRNVVDRLFLGCGTDGLACVEFGFREETEERDEERGDANPWSPTSYLAWQYSERHFFRQVFR